MTIWIIWKPSWTWIKAQAHKALWNGFTQEHRVTFFAGNPLPQHREHHAYTRITISSLPRKASRVNRRILLLLLCLLLALAGCAGKRPPAPPPPAVLTPAIWQRIDQDLIEASVAATGSANDYARRSMRVWKDQVQQRTESDFIPWFTGYWTQQWLTLKVAWYKMNSGDGAEPPERRLALYLQEQYHRRVIEPVAEQINPEGIRDRASELYLQLFGQQLPAIIQRYNAPPDQVSQRLNRIRIIALGPPAARDATLYQLLRAKSLDQQPAWQALRQHLHQQAAKAPGQTQAGLSSVANRASEKLGATLAPRGQARAHRSCASPSGSCQRRCRQPKDPVERPVVDEGVARHQDDERQVHQERFHQGHVQPPGDQRDQVHHQRQLEADGMPDTPGHTAATLGLAAFPPFEQAVVDQVPEHGDGGDHHRQRPGMGGLCIGQVGQAQGRHAQADQFIEGHIDQFAFDSLQFLSLDVSRKRPG